MAKESVNKWLALLVVLVAVSLVVDLLSINVLYGISNSRAPGQGELASYGGTYGPSYCPRATVTCNWNRYPHTCSCLENYADCAQDACLEDFSETLCSDELGRCLNSYK